MERTSVCRLYVLRACPTFTGTIETDTATNENSYKKFLTMEFFLYRRYRKTMRLIEPSGNKCNFVFDVSERLRVETANLQTVIFI